MASLAEIKSLTLNIPNDKKNRNQVVTEFNKTILLLLNFVKKRAAPDSIAPIETLIRRINLAKNIDHEVIITSVGPYIHKYRGSIKFIKTDDNAFVKYFNEEIKTSTLNVELQKESIEIFRIIMETKRGTIEVIELNELCGICQELIDLYLCFCIRCKVEIKR